MQFQLFGVKLYVITKKKAKDCLRTIAGKYKVIRFEISSRKSFGDMLTYRIDRTLKAPGTNHNSFTPHRLKRVGAFFSLTPGLFSLDGVQPVSVTYGNSTRRIEIMP